MSWAPIRAAVPLLVDGLEQSDNFGLNFSGVIRRRPRRSLYPWINQYQLIVTPYDVEYNSCGPVQNIVTKSGTNDFHGGFYGSFERPGAWAAIIRAARRSTASRPSS